MKEILEKLPCLAVFSFFFKQNYKKTYSNAELKKTEIFYTYPVRYRDECATICALCFPLACVPYMLKLKEN